MTRLILFLTAFVLALPAIADDDNKGRAGVMKALRADCEREANQLNLVGKERKTFVKDCTKKGKHVNRRRDERRDRNRRDDGTPAAAGPAQPAPPPATPAAAPPVSTAPAQPAPPPSQPASTSAQTAPVTPPASSAPPRAATPASTTQPAGTVMTAEQKRAKCADEAKRTGVPIPQRMRFVETCMAR